MTDRILIAEDEPRIATFIEKGLRASGFSSAIAKDGHEALSMAQTGDFNLLLLDIGLPGKDGWMVLEELRGQGEQISIIILSARDDVSDKVAGLEGGADDYITKPFRFEELLARVRARLRDNRLVRRQEETILKTGKIVLNLLTRQIWVGDHLLKLSAREFILAETFVRHPGQVMSREQLLSRVWGYDYDPGSNVVDVCVGCLRKKLGHDYIETVRGMGYRLRT
ncbi:MAG: response regulator [Brasilonema octagenarum HA4186-MV1]|jgi:DNA-binding response OmpR family regulator|uniref:DNA-binding response regulator n=1 Tax=Brasilonema octagenarum UFV-OR1 TaxID=417115 RepID=A0ABX1MA02_9CYAN|nr:response regulator transcription factor [Brasilonema octagenarum]MBW4626077.1 response regulator [Brasilonema octagenarum HA4186-MV1]NMF65423.1 DNA-binding response regulator [Brasilonema octagenarum UFV-OR1]